MAPIQSDRPLLHQNLLIGPERTATRPGPARGGDSFPPVADTRPAICSGTGFYLNAL